MKNLKNAVASILDSNTFKKELAAVNALQICYHKLCNNLCFDDSLTGNKETIVSGGVALSSKHAKDCLEDSIRTARFLKGIYKALMVAKARFKKEKITILYAGCGPLGTLIIPLLHLFSDDDIEIILLDIHQTSINSVIKIVKELGYESYINKYLVADATKYKHPKNKFLHVVISETMDRALVKEPQVEIIKNLSKQLVSNGIFVPEKIKVNRGYSSFSKEYVFNSFLNEDKLKNNFKTKIEELFSITKDIDSDAPYENETHPL